MADILLMPEAKRALRHPLTREELRTLHSARGGRRVVTCDDRSCCPDFEGMTDHPQRHVARQWQKHIDELATVPNLSRSRHFVVGQMSAVRRKARALAGLGHDNERLKKSLKIELKRIENLSEIMENFHEEREAEAPRSLPIVRRAAGATAPQSKRHT